MGVENLHPFDHLNGQHANGLHRELFLAHKKQVLEVGPQHFHHHEIRLVFISIPNDFGKSFLAVKRFQEAGLSNKLGVFVFLILLNIRLDTFFMAYNCCVSTIFTR